MTSSVPPRRCACRLELRRSSREIDESKSDVINTTDSVHRQSSRHSGCARKMVFSENLTRGLCVCVFLKHVTSQASKIELDPSMDWQP